MERSFQICVENQIPIGFGHSHAETVTSDACVVYQDVHFAKVLENLRADSCYRTSISDINGIDTGSPCPDSIDLISRVLGVALSPADDGQSCALTREPQCDGLANPA